MTTLQRSFIALILPLCAAASCIYAQNTCPGPPPLRGTANGNMFTELQEMDLGDVMSQRQEADFHVVEDEHLNDYLNQVAQRLLAQMPPTEMKFRIVLVDLPVVNAFTMPGGRVYVTRKLVAFVQSEDELAGVLGHELGHALTHQPAADMSRLFREVLGVTQVGNRADIFLKYNQLIENAARKHLHFNPRQDQEEQLVADSYALYAMTRAGYSPKAMASFWDRRTETEGKTGNWFTDLFGTTSPNEQRLRQMRLYSPVMPASCIASQSESIAAFRAWQQSVIAYSASAEKESLPDLLWKRQLSPPLESEVTNVKFSPDGKYLLAQDDFSVYVLTSNPLKPVFRIPVDDVEPAAFTPDSQFVLIWTRALHIEKWSVTSQRRTDVREVVTPESCFQSDVSPDGGIAACVHIAEAAEGLRFDLSLIDTETSASLIAKQNFYQPTRTDLFQFLLFALMQRRFGFFYMDFSPDGKYFAISRGYGELAWDLHSHAPVKLAAAVKDVMSGGFTFDGPDRIVGINAFNPKKSGSAQFPGGPADPPIAFYEQTFAAPAHGDGILVRPAGNNAVAFVDLKTSKAPLVSQMSALDVYNNVYARPLPDGSIAIFDLSTRRAIASTPLPGHWIGHPVAADVSLDLKWFAASAKTRGAVWNLTTGERVFHVRGFAGCGFSPDDNLYAEFPAFLKEKRNMGLLNPINRTAQPVGKLDDDTQISQVGTYLLYVRRAKAKWNGPVDFEVHDAVSGATLWTRHFSHESPHVSISAAMREMALVLRLNSDEAKEELKQHLDVAAEAKGISSKDAARLIQIVNAQDGRLRAEFVVDTGKGSFTIRDAVPAGKWAVVTDNHNRVLIYSLDGKITGRLFGTARAISGASGEVAVESDPGTLKIYSLGTAELRETLRFGTPLAFYQFVGTDSKLFAVTEDQTAYLLNLH